MDTEQEKGRKALQAYGQAGHYLGLGLQFAVSILLGLGGGWWLDGKFGTSPLFFLLGSLLGAVAGFYSLYRAMVEEQERERQRKKQ